MRHDAAQHSVVESQKEDTKSYSNEIKQLNADGKKGQGILREPYRIMRDGTVEGIRRSFRQGLPSQGVFSSEAGIMLAGYGMTPDNRTKSAANFNSLWDNGEISVARGQDGRLQLYDRRLSLHWLIQPDVALSAINDPMLSDIGFWPRFLLACPPPSKPLMAMKFTPDKHSEIRDFWAACSNFLDEPLCEDCSELPVIEATPEAEELACKFYNFMQLEAKSEEGSLIYVKPFAVRATEQAFRIAAILSIFAGYIEIDVEMMRNGISLSGYSVATWSGVFGDGEEQVADRNALNLYKWLLKQPYQIADGRTILRLGPPMLRSMSKRDIALAVLLQAELICQDNKSYSVIVEV